MMKKILMTMILAAVMAVCSCGRAGFDEAKYETLLNEVSHAKKMQDVTKEQWCSLYSQFMSLDASLRDQIMTLLATLNNSGFAPSAYFSSTEVSDMQAAADATILEMQNLLAQADLDGK